VTTNKEIDQESLNTATTLGDAVCKELGICCDKRGQVIFQIFQKLREIKLKNDTTAEPKAPETQAGKSSSTSSG
jgi:hypothetical protein